ncbi:hypothetical protein E24_00476 [Faustovirus]|nr:hypothetical protein PRJ_Fausto_00447 [Faustovirus]AMN83389.1 hypothetical protein E24_00476 [Faustovirus]QBR99352.1 hypothetical protein [Faustovirus mariensis]
MATVYERLCELMKTRYLLPSDVADMMGIERQTFEAYLSRAPPITGWKKYEEMINDKLQILEPINIAPMPPQSCEFIYPRARLSDLNVNVLPALSAPIIADDEAPVLVMSTPKSKSNKSNKSTKASKVTKATKVKKHGIRMYASYIGINSANSVDNVTITSPMYITADKLQRIKDILMEPTPTIDDMLAIDDDLTLIDAPISMLSEVPDETPITIPTITPSCETTIPLSPLFSTSGIDKVTFTYGKLN